MIYKVNYVDNTIRTADYNKPKSVSRNKKTTVNVKQNMPLSLWVHFTRFFLYFVLVILYIQISKIKTILIDSA